VDHGGTSYVLSGARKKGVRVAENLYEDVKKEEGWRRITRSKILALPCSLQKGGNCNRGDIQRVFAHRALEKS